MVGIASPPSEQTARDRRRAGKDGVDGRVHHAGGPAAAGEVDVFTRVLRSPRDVVVVVAGARNAAMSMVVRTFGVWSGVPSPLPAWSRPLGKGVADG
jgi:hypothetical protein